MCFTSASMLSTATLHPLTTKNFQFSYCFDRPLQCIATCYVPISPSPPSDTRTSFALLFACGISLNQQTWLPVIKEIYRLTSDENCPVHILSAWVVEQPNHGDAGVLNAKVLQEHYLKMFKTAQYGSAIRAFLDSGALSAVEKESLVGIGHSGGVGGMIQALEMAKSHSPLSVLIGVDPCWVEYDARDLFQPLHAAVVRSNSRRPQRWRSESEAMQWLITHRPWKNFHPEVLQVISECYFLPDSNNPGSVVPKTTIEQETASFMSDGSQLVAVPFIRTIFHLLPTHLIMAEKRDFWSSEVESLIRKNLQKDRPALASIREVDGGHYLPVTKPKELASEIIQILLKPKGRFPEKL